MLGQIGRFCHLAHYLSDDRHPQEADMNPWTSKKISAWLSYWSYATTAGNMAPPRDPDDDDEDEDEDDDVRDEDLDPAVIREPDE